jgi:hypothetical protein
VSLSLPYDVTLDGGVNASHVQSNFTTIANKFGALVAADMPSLILPSSQLTASSVEEFIRLEYDGPGVGAVWPAASTTVPVDIIRIPGSGVYTVVGASYTAVVPTGGTGGTVTGSLSINAGTLSGTDFASSSTIVASVAMSNSLTAAGKTVGGDLTISTATFTGPIYIALLSTLVGTTTVPRVRVTLRVTRGLQ